MGTGMNETDSSPNSYPLSDASGAEVARKPRKKELKNLTRRKGIWQFLRIVNGKKEKVSLGTRDLVVAKAKRDALLKAKDKQEVDRVTGRDSRAVATLGQICEAYRKAPTVRANERTRKANIKDLERMVRTMKGEDCDVESASSTLLTKQFVKDWQARCLAALVKDARGNQTIEQAGRRSLNSTLTHVRSLFSKEARDDYGRLHLPPNIEDFMSALPVAARKQEEPEQLTDEVVASLLDKMELLREEDAAAWVVFQLMAWGGLRNKECYHAREFWLEKHPSGVAYRLVMKQAADFTPKGNSRAVVIPSNVAEGILSLLEKPDESLLLGGDEESRNRYLVPGKNPTDRHEACYRRLNVWLKSHGVTEDAGKIAYRLRKYFLAQVAEQQGLALAQAAGGHSSLSTTINHYVGGPKMKAPIQLGPRPTPAPEPAPSPIPVAASP